MCNGTLCFAVTRVFRPNVYGFGAAAAGEWPDGLAKKRKNSESGRSRKRVSLERSPVSYAVIER